MDAGPGTDVGGLGWYLGIWIAAAPDSVPGLSDPGRAPTMHMMDSDTGMRPPG